MALCDLSTVEGEQTVRVLGLHTRRDRGDRVRGRRIHGILLPKLLQLLIDGHESFLARGLLGIQLGGTDIITGGGAVELLVDGLDLGL